MVRSQQDGVWDTSRTLRQYRALQELVVGVLGVGQMGLATAGLFRKVGCRVVGLVTSPRQPGDGISRYYTRDQLGEMLSTVDYILAMLPATPDTDDLLGGDVLAACAGRPVGLVNVGRGNVISEDDLVKAVDNGWISSAVLDVFREEPLPSSSRLWGHPAVTVTPHVAAISRPQDIADCFKMNLERETQGLEPACLVDWNKFY